MTLRLLLLSVAISTACLGQLTTEQRLFDFDYLAARLAVSYAPYEWKREFAKFDHYETAPWRERIRNAKSDLEFYEISHEYIAALKDTHTTLYIPSNFYAFIDLSVDIFDEKYLIESISRTSLPIANYPFAIGDEIVSIDGKTPAELTAWISKFISSGNPRATLRSAADYLFYRPQYGIPRAHEISAAASVQIRRRSGTVETFEIPWTKRGVPLTDSSPLPPLLLSSKSRAIAAPTADQLLRRFQTKKVPRVPQRLIGFGQRNPIFTLPPGFVRRLGSLNSHFHYSGTYQSGGKRIGYLRFPDFDPPTFGAYPELATEIAFLKANTDGLVIDITRNAGGICYGQDALQLIIPKSFRGATDEIRPSLSDLQYYEFLKSNPFLDLEQWQVNLLTSVYQQLAQAYSENRGRTGPLPVCSETIDVEPLRNRDGSLTAYDKPIVLLTDEFTISWGDTFAQIFADAKRGPLFGLRTNGAGGSVLWGEGGPYSEGSLSYTTSLGTRATPVAAPGYPVTTYYENVGIHPDIPYDIMTEENLRSGYRPYVEAFTQAILAEINKAVN